MPLDLPELVAEAIHHGRFVSSGASSGRSFCSFHITHSAPVITIAAPISESHELAVTVSYPRTRMTKIAAPISRASRRPIRRSIASYRRSRRRRV
jgi:hypothetical protein